MNVFHGLGNFTRDPELRRTNSGTAVVNFGIALNHRFKAGDGEKREEVIFLDCDAWDSGAEVISKYFTKGSPIIVQGRLIQDNWEDKTTGDKRSKIKLRVEKFEFVPGNKGVASAPASAPPGDGQNQGQDEDEDEDKVSF